MYAKNLKFPAGFNFSSFMFLLHLSTNEKWPQVITAMIIESE